uniref:Uncharacterized protein n=1 Tax=Mycena chlorophos TaxID=658473 RepID=A0ABQ0LH18_MYCCL|nr:predicted protein [Mycena chlorophos]
MFSGSDGAGYILTHDNIENLCFIHHLHSPGMNVPSLLDLLILPRLSTLSVRVGDEEEVDSVVNLLNRSNLSALHALVLTTSHHSDSWGHVLLHAFRELAAQVPNLTHLDVRPYNPIRREAMEHLARDDVWPRLKQLVLRNFTPQRTLTALMSTMVDARRRPTLQRLVLLWTWCGANLFDFESLADIEDNADFEMREEHLVNSLPAGRGPSQQFWTRNPPWLWCRL